MKKLSISFLVQIVASIAPSLAILFAVRILSLRLDSQVFAAFSVIISIVGFLSILDGGIGRSCTFFVKRAVTLQNNNSIPSIVRGSLLLGLILALLVMGTSWIILSFQLGPSLQAAIKGLHILLFFIPIFIANTVFKGVLEAQNKFIHSAFLTLFQGVFISIIPIFLLRSLNDIANYALAIGGARAVLLFMQILISRINILSTRSADAESITGMASYTKWLFASNVIGIIIVFSDRLVVASSFDYIEVSAYMIPMELVARSMIITGALASVMFPHLVAKSFSKQNNSFPVVEKLKIIITKATFACGFAILPHIKFLLGWLLGPSIGIQSQQVLVIGIVGIALSSSSLISMIGINSMGHTKQVAYLHALELPILIILLYAAAQSQSLLLIQATWITRLIADFFGMNLILQRLSQSYKNKPVFRFFSFAQSLRNGNFSSTAIMIVWTLLILLAYNFQSHMDATIFFVVTTVLAVLLLISFGLDLSNFRKDTTPSILAGV